MPAKTAQRNMAEVAHLLKTAGDPSRLHILCVMFQNKKICVSEIATTLGMSVAIVSHHLQVMMREGLVEPRRDGKRIYYTFKDKNFGSDLKRLICKYIDK